MGYRVDTWRASGGALPPLGDVEIVLNLLPLTAATCGLLDARFFAALPRGASVVNLARGGHVVDADLLAALDAGQLHRAVLDVFHAEPLPAEHAYWHHPRVTVLPHVAALTDVRSGALVVAANLRALARGEPLANGVDRSRGY
jgi:glyoxylate/hydroxypyruvate reductase A